jgi:HEAT repeat protein
MRRSRSVLLVLAGLAVPSAARAGDDAAPTPAALVQALKSDDGAKRRDALSALLLGVRALPKSEEARVRGALETVVAREPDPGNRALGILALARLGGEAALAPLLARLAVEEEPGPQAALVEAFGELPSASAGRALSEAAFRPPEPRAGALAAEALGRVAGDDPLRALLALAGTTHPWPVEAAVVRALGLRTDPRAVEAVIASLRDSDPAVRIAARESGEALLGEDLGEDPEAWEKRWAAVKGEWVPPSARPAAAPRPEVVTGPAPAAEVRTVARFYGLPVAGARVAFVVDCSQSMWGPKMDAAKAEMEGAVKGLRGSQRFGVVLFQDRVWTWRDDLVPATPAQKWAFVRTIPDLPTRSYTNIHDALERAFAWSGQGRWALPVPPGLDEVFFMSDGLPNRGRTREPDRIAEAVREWAGAGRVRVHAVALGERSAVDLLERIARESGGRFAKRE